jgi:hypothetical protein
MIMSDYIKVEDSFVASLVENAAWKAARVTLSDKEGEVVEEEEKVVEEAKKAKKAKKEMKEEDDEKDDVDPSGGPITKESVEEHTCPLCESVLAEELSDDTIFEHVAQIKAALQSLEEAAPDPDEEDVEEEAESKKEKVLKKVDAMKASAQA